MCVPLEKVSGGGSNACVASSPGCIPGGSSVGAKYAFWASWTSVMPDVGAPHQLLLQDTRGSERRAYAHHAASSAARAHAVRCGGRITGLDPDPFDRHCSLV